jgi:hypothetical protein
MPRCFPVQQASGEGSLSIMDGHPPWREFDQFANTHGLANQRTIPDEHQQPFELSKSIGS